MFLNIALDIKPSFLQKELELDFINAVFLLHPLHDCGAVEGAKNLISKFLI